MRDTAKRRHECRRGTHECVRHGVKESLRRSKKRSGWNTVGLFATLELLGKDVGATGEVVGGAQVAGSFGFAGALDELIDAGDERLFGGGEAAALGLRDQLEGLALVILRGLAQLLLHVSGQDFLNGRPGRTSSRALLPVKPLR